MRIKTLLNEWLVCAKRVKTKMRLNIEATLFEPGQTDPFFDSLQTYRDDRLWLLLGTSWLELEKFPHDDSSENVPYKVVGARVPGEGSLAKRVLSLFDDRYLPVEVGSAFGRKLSDVDPVSTKTLSFEMSKIYKKERGPSRETEGVLIQNVPLWRPEQLHAFSFWVNSYPDKNIEVGLSAGRKHAYLMLRKLGVSENDPPYVVAGCASEEMDIFKFLAEMFPRDQTRPPIKSYVTKTEHDKNWNFFNKPMPIKQFVYAVSLQYDEGKR